MDRLCNSIGKSLTTWTGHHETSCNLVRVDDYLLGFGGGAGRQDYMLPCGSRLLCKRSTTEKTDLSHYYLLNKAL